MPATAKATAKRLRLSFKKSQLTHDPSYNISIGSAHLADLLEQYEGSPILAVAACNAGAGNVDEWIDLFGDPRAPHTDAIDWIEKIPFYETRNYVQRVLEGRHVYKLRLGNTPETRPK